MVPKYPVIHDMHPDFCMTCAGHRRVQEDGGDHWYWVDCKDCNGAQKREADPRKD